MDPDKKVKDMSVNNLNHYSSVYQISCSANFKWAKAKIMQLINPKKLNLVKKRYNKKNVL